MFTARTVWLRKISCQPSFSSSNICPQPAAGLGLGVGRPRPAGARRPITSVRTSRADTHERDGVDVEGQGHLVERRGSRAAAIEPSQADTPASSANSSEANGNVP